MHEFWKGKKVFITGHTGFKGAWMCLLLNKLGADVTGYALDPPTDPSLYELCKIDTLIESRSADVRSLDALALEMQAASPEIVIHMAAQAIVRDSYNFPVLTYSTNVMGTVNVLEAVRETSSVRAVINVTSDKCYENRELSSAFREDEPLGGYDPYSSSKACSELVTSAYRRSFFNPEKFEEHGVALASARTGNVIGGGDWAPDRLIPDCIRAFLKGEKVLIRNPDAVRPWQHVLDPLNGYLILAKKLFVHGVKYADAYNFGPAAEGEKTVKWVVEKLCKGWDQSAAFEVNPGGHPHEAHFLKLDSSKAMTELHWKPVWNAEAALEKIIEWNTSYRKEEDVRDICLRQFEEYFNQSEASTN